MNGYALSGAWDERSDLVITNAIVYRDSPPPLRIAKKKGRRGKKMRAAWNRKNGLILWLADLKAPAEWIESPPPS